MRFTTQTSRWTRFLLELTAVITFAATLSVAAVAVAETEAEAEAEGRPTETGTETEVGTAAVAEAVAEVVAEVAAEPLAEEVIAPTLHATFLGDQHVEATEPANDLFLFGQHAVSRAEVEDNALVFAQYAEIREGHVDGDLMIGGETMVIDAPISGDVYAVGGELHIADDAVVGGDVHLAAGKLVVDGTVGGRIAGGAGAAIINGVVGEVRNLEIGELVLGEDAHVAGDLIYSAPEPATIADGAVVGGTTDFTLAVHEHGEGFHYDDGDDDDSILGWMFTHTWLFLAALLTGAVLIRISGPAARRTADALQDQPGRSLGLGFVAMIVIPIASMLAIVTLLPLPLGMIGMALYGIALYVTGLIASHALGRALLRRFTGREEVSAYGSLALGLVIVHLFLAIPFVGFLTRLVIVSAGLGALWVASRNHGTFESDAV